jgi:predicted transcriptional regulator
MTAAAKTLNVRLPEALYAQLEQLAAATTRTKSFLAVEALAAYLQSESWQVQDIKAGLAEADAGEFASEQEVNAVFAKYGSAV